MTPKPPPQPQASRRHLPGHRGRRSSSATATPWSPPCCATPSRPTRPTKSPPRSKPPAPTCDSYDRATPCSCIATMMPGQPCWSTHQAPGLRFKAINRDGRWKVERSTTQPEIRVEMRQGEVKNSLWDAVESGAVAPLGLARPGADFRIRVRLHRRHATRRPLQHPDRNHATPMAPRLISDASWRPQYISGEQTLTGIGFAPAGGDPERLNYYDAQGNSLKKMFLRSPLEFSRIRLRFHLPPPASDTWRRQAASGDRLRGTDRHAGVGGCRWRGELRRPQRPATASRSGYATAPATRPITTTCRASARASAAARASSRNRSSAWSARPASPPAPHLGLPGKTRRRLR